MTTISFRCSEEQKSRITELLGQNSNGEEKMRAILDKFEEKNLNSEELERLQAENRTISEECENLKALLEAEKTEKELHQVATSARIEELEEELKTEQRKIFPPTAPKENELRFEVPQPALSLLKEYAKRLGVAPQDILIDMFVRYVTEQYNKWFFEFEVKKSEFKEVCGFSHREVLTWLNSMK